MPRYRFRLPDGQTFESTNTPAQIRKVHPTAVITHRVEFDSVGNPQMHPFAGKQEEEPKVEEKNYEPLTVAELKAEAEQRALHVPSDIKKADLIALLRADDQAKTVNAPTPSVSDIQASSGDEEAQTGEMTSEGDEKAE